MATRNLTEMTKQERFDYLQTMQVNQYHCPNCNTNEAIWPVFRGNHGRRYECVCCGRGFSNSDYKNYWVAHMMRGH